MADVLIFKSRPAAAVARQPKQGPAEIVIFPGVRYEYHDEAPRPQTRRQARRRDLHELAE